MTIPLPTPIIDSYKCFKEGNQQTASLTPAFASYDLACCLDYLKQYDDNSATFESYRRELERLLQWSWRIEKKSILDLKRQDIENYVQFCLNPPKAWIGIKKVARFITRNGQRTPNSDWRPFVVSISKDKHKNGIRPDIQDYQLSQKAIREIFTVLSSFYNFLLLEEKVLLNPIALIRQKSKYIQKRQSAKQVMRLSEKQWQTCLETAKQMAEKEPVHERTLFIMSALYLLYLRISELCANERWLPVMGHFYKDSQGCW